MASFSFENSFYLLFLFVVPLLVFLHIVTLRMAKSRALKFANFEAIGRVKGIDLFSKNVIVLILSIFLVVLVSLALAGFTYHVETDATDHSYVIALDNSESMEADDLSPNRLGAAKAAALRFVDLTPIATKIGVLSFSGNTIIEQTVSDQKLIIKQAIREIELSDVSGTDILEAIVTGTNLLEGEDSKALIILSDGQLNVGTLQEAFVYAEDNGVLIHTIALGTSEGGETSYGISKVDEDTLQSVAFNTGGEYFRAIDEASLEQSFSDAITLTRKKVAINLRDYLLIAALVVFVLMYFLMSTKFRTLP